MPPPLWTLPPTGQTDHGNELIFGTQGHLWMTTWAIGAIFEILPLSRVMGGLGLTPGVEKSRKIFFRFFSFFCQICSVLCPNFLRIHAKTFKKSENGVLRAYKKYCSFYRFLRILRKSAGEDFRKPQHPRVSRLTVSCADPTLCRFQSAARNRREKPPNKLQNKLVSKKKQKRFSQVLHTLKL